MISLITKGILSNSLITKGILNFRIIEKPIVKKKRGSSGVSDLRRKLIVISFNYKDNLYEFKRQVPINYNINIKNIDIDIINDNPKIIFKNV